MGSSNSTKLAVDQNRESYSDDAKARRVTLVGEEGSSLTQEDGNIELIRVSDIDQEQLLADILKELKKMNLHLMIISDNVFKNEDIEV